MSKVYIMLFLYIVLVNIVAFILFGVDKFKAKKGKWRIPENTLLAFAIAGGGIGSYCGMKLWHHKTLHKKFVWGIPLILILQIVIVFLFFSNA